MILDKNTEIIIGRANIKYYLSVGYTVNKGDKVLIDVKDLRKGTPIKINVECDICGAKNKIYLQKYHFNNDRYGYYSCINCADIKRKQTNNKKYGVDNASQSDIIKNKKKETTLKNYGVENPSQSKLIKKLKCETMMKNYGVEYAMQNRELFIKSKLTSNKIQIYKNTEISYQGSYEKNFLDKYYDKIEISEIDEIKYKFNEKNKCYHPDFYCKKLNLIVEIKSEYIYNKEVDKNLAKKTACINQGFNFIFIINKDYSDFDNIVSS